MKQHAKLQEKVDSKVSVTVHTDRQTQQTHCPQQLYRLQFSRTLYNINSELLCRSRLSDALPTTFTSSLEV